MYRVIAGLVVRGAICGAVTRLMIFQMDIRWSTI
jgi:hypothetical protein